MFVCSEFQKKMRITECSKGNKQVNHHIHIKIVDDTYIYIRNNLDFEDCCLDSSTLNLKINKYEFSE